MEFDSETKILVVVLQAAQFHEGLSSSKVAKFLMYNSCQVMIRM
jgi:hypothetical protein